MANLTDAEISQLVRELGPADVEQIKLIAHLPPEQRIVPALRAQAFALAAYRGALRLRYPDLPMAELNMRALRHFTVVRIA